MIKQSLLHVVVRIAVVSIAAVILLGCQPVQPPGSPTQADLAIEQRKAEALAQELRTFDVMIARDWPAFDDLTHPNFYQIGSDGAYIERAAMITGAMDDKLVVRKPDLGEMRVEMLSADVYLITYPLNFNGSYDGKDFSNPRTVTSLWVFQHGKWQNIFLVDQIRTAEFTPADTD